MTPGRDCFSMINELPTVSEILTGNVKHDQSENHNGRSKDKSSTKQSESHNKLVKTSTPRKRIVVKMKKTWKLRKRAEPELVVMTYVPDEFRICCDVCENWVLWKVYQNYPCKG